MKQQKRWVVPLGEHGGRAVITIDRVHDLVVIFEDEDTVDAEANDPPIACIAMVSPAGCNLGLALLEASRVAGAARAKAALAKPRKAKR